MEQTKSSLGTAGLVLGIIAFCTAIIPVINFISFILGVIAFIFGIITVSKDERKGRAIVTIVLSILTGIIVIGEYGAMGNATKNAIETTSSVVEQTTTQTQTQSQTVQEPANDYMVVDYNTLHQEYQDNAIAADAKYRGKKLQVTGEVEDIYREIAGNPYVTFNVGGKYSFKNVRLTFKKSEESKVAGLSKGQTITVRGVCRGALLTTTVSLDDCEIVK